jgi:hypothetical protein
MSPMYTNQRCAGARVLNDSIMQYTTIETCDLRVSVLHTGASRLCISHVAHEIHDILLSKEQRKDSEFDVKDAQLINAQVLSLPYCYIL